MAMVLTVELLFCPRAVLTVVVVADLLQRAQSWSMLGKLMQRAVSYTYMALVYRNRSKGTRFSTLSRQDPAAS